MNPQDRSILDPVRLSSVRMDRPRHRPDERRGGGPPVPVSRLLQISRSRFLEMKSLLLDTTIVNETGLSGTSTLSNPRPPTGQNHRKTTSQVCQEPIRVFFSLGNWISCERDWGRGLRTYPTRGSDRPPSRPLTNLTSGPR